MISEKVAVAINGVIAIEHLLGGGGMLGGKNVANPRGQGQDLVWDSQVTIKHNKCLFSC